MRVSCLVASLSLALPAAAASHRWVWRLPPQVAELHACEATMERLVAARPELVEIVTDPERSFDFPIAFAGRSAAERDPFLFPGSMASHILEGMKALNTARREQGRGAIKLPEEMPAGTNAIASIGKPYDEVVTACLLAAYACLPPGTIEITSDVGFAEWAPGAALYERVTGVAAKNPLGDKLSPRRRDQLLGAAAAVLLLGLFALSRKKPA